MKRYLIYSDNWIENEQVGKTPPSLNSYIYTSALSYFFDRPSNWDCRRRYSGRYGFKIRLRSEDF
jgi:hypothetical protein